MMIALMAWNGHDGYGPGPWWPVFPILWLVVIAAVAVTFAILWRRRSASYQPDPTGAAVAQLAERFARGEIAEQEYHERLAVLRQSNQNRDK